MTIKMTFLHLYSTGDASDESDEERDLPSHSDTPTPILHDDEDDSFSAGEITSHATSPHLLSPNINIPGRNKEESPHSDNLYSQLDNEQASSNLHSSSLPNFRSCKDLYPKANTETEVSDSAGCCSTETETSKDYCNTETEDSRDYSNPETSRGYCITDSNEYCSDKSSSSAAQESSLTEVCYESVLWLSDRLGPVLTAKHLTRNLLRMLSVCYKAETGALTPIPSDQKDVLSVTRKRVLGDRSSARVLDCLSSVACLYGEEYIMEQYVKHICNFIPQCRKKLSEAHEADLLACAVLLQHLIPYISDGTFMSCLDDTLIKHILYPLIRLLASTRIDFPGASAARACLAYRVVDIIFIMALR